MDITNLEANALYYDYSSAANPLVQNIITAIPYKSFSPSFLRETTRAFCLWI